MLNILDSRNTSEANNQKLTRSQRSQKSQKQISKSKHKQKLQKSNGEGEDD